MPILATKKLFTTQYHDDYHKNKRQFRQTTMRPTSRYRRNNPHPQGDFLEPKNLKEQDAQQILHHRVQRAVHDYVLKSLGEGSFNNIARVLQHREYPQLSQSLPGVSVHATQPKGVNVDAFIKSSLDLLERSKHSDRQEMKRERGNHYKAAAKSYGEVPDSPAPSPVRYKSPVRKPLVDLSMAPITNKTKRTHTPPTPPPQARRPKSAAYEAQVASGGAQTKPVIYRAKTAPIPEDENGEEKEKGDANSDEKAISDSGAKSAGQDVAKGNLAPRMKAWIEGANDFEKEVAYNMLQTLNGGPAPSRPKGQTPAQSPGPGVGARANKSGRVPAATHIYVPPSPAPRQAIPTRSGRDDVQVKEWMKKLQEKLNLQEYKNDVDRQYTQKISLPRPQIVRKQGPKIAEDYRHENSHFLLTKPPYRRHFVIAPDWVSERQSHRRLVQQGWARKNRHTKAL